MGVGTACRHAAARQRALVARCQRGGTDNDDRAAARGLRAQLLARRTREDFVALMGELKLAYPRFMDRALPANQACGREVAS